MPRKPSGKAVTQFLNSRVAVKPLGSLPKMRVAEHPHSPVSAGTKAAVTRLRAQIRAAMGR
jgi:hypothetical protein